MESPDKLEHQGNAWVEGESVERHIVTSETIQNQVYNLNNNNSLQIILARKVYF